MSLREYEMKSFRASFEMVIMSHLASVFRLAAYESPTRASYQGNRVLPVCKQRSFCIRHRFLECSQQSILFQSFPLDLLSSAIHARGMRHQRNHIMLKNRKSIEKQSLILLVVVCHPVLPEGGKRWDLARNCGKTREYRGLRAWCWGELWVGICRSVALRGWKLRAGRMCGARFRGPFKTASRVV